MKIILWPFKFVLKLAFKLLLLPILLIVGTVKLLADIVLGLGGGLIVFVMLLALVGFVLNGDFSMNQIIGCGVCELLLFIMFFGASLIIAVLELMVEGLIGLMAI